MNRKHVLATIVVTVTAVTAIACGSGARTKSSVSGSGAAAVKTAAPQKATTGNIGQTITLSNDDLGQKTVVDVTVAKPTQYSKEPGEFGSKPEHGVFLVLTVTAVCKTGTYSSNPFNFKFVAKDGTVSETAFTAAFNPDLDATDLAAGQKASGKIVFDVPKAALKGGRIQISGVGLDYDEPAAYWTL